MWKGCPQREQNSNEQQLADKNVLGGGNFVCRVRLLRPRIDIKVDSAMEGKLLEKRLCPKVTPDERMPLEPPRTARRMPSIREI